MRKLKGYFLADVKRAFVSSKFLMAIVLMIIILFLPRWKALHWIQMCFMFFLL